MLDKCHEIHYSTYHTERQIEKQTDRVREREEREREVEGILTNIYCTVTVNGQRIFCSV